MQKFGKLIGFCGGRSVGKAEIIFLDGKPESQKIIRGNAENYFGRGKSVNLRGENVSQTFRFVGENFFHALIAIKPLDNLGDKMSAFHVRIDKSFFGRIETAGAFALHVVNHQAHGFFRRENLIRPLRGNVIENIFFVRLVEVVGKFSAAVKKFLNGVVESHGIEKFSFVAQVSELFKRNRRQLDKNFVGNNFIERGKRNGIVNVVVSHEERGNRSREAAQMFAHVVQDGNFFLLANFCFDALDDIFPRGFGEIVDFLLKFGVENFFGFLPAAVEFGVNFFGGTFTAIFQRVGSVAFKDSIVQFVIRKSFVDKILRFGV